MRRKDREVSDLADIRSIIDKCNCCELGLALGDIPYAVPLNFGYELIGDKLTLYFHGALEGKKLDIIRQNPNACFVMHCGHNLVQGETACSTTMEYESVMGFGLASIIADAHEKRRGLSILSSRYDDGKARDIPDAAIDSVAVIRLDVEMFSAKRLTK